MPGSRERSGRRRSRSPPSPRKDRRDDYGDRRGDRAHRDGDRGSRRSKFDRSSPNEKAEAASKGGHYGPAEGAQPADAANRFSYNPESNGPIIPTNYDLPSRKIYVGGIGQHHSESDVSGFLGEMLLKAKACLEEGNPVIKT
jgi:hypothetical protein